VERVTRRELLIRGGKYALVAAGTMPIAGRIVDLARAAATGIFDELAQAVTGAVVVRGDAAYDQARVLYNTRFDAYKPQAVVFCESLADVQRTVRTGGSCATRPAHADRYPLRCGRDGESGTGRDRSRRRTR